MRRADIEEQNHFLLQRQRAFRMAAEVVTGAFIAFSEVEAIAVIGSVAGPLWKEVPRFSEFRRKGVKLWHECKDLDLAIWLSSQDRLGELRRARDVALREAHDAGTRLNVTSFQVEIFLFESGSDCYLGRLCNFNTCPKGKLECHVPGCGAVPFNKRVAGFTLHTDILAPAAHATLYRRGAGWLKSALDLPLTEDDHDTPV